jgi:hypothetical protein
MDTAPRHCKTDEAEQTHFDFIADDTANSVPKQKKSARSGAFTDNMSLPIHRWFRYSAGFSADWVSQTLCERTFRENEVVFDPFAGSGTTLLAAQCAGLPAFGAESHPFVERIANTKLGWQSVDSDVFLDLAYALHGAALKANTDTLWECAGLLEKCYTPEALTRLFALRDIFISDFSDRGEYSDLLWLAITAILRECSGVGTAQWQYVLPNKTKAKVLDPFAAFLKRAKMFYADIRQAQNSYLGSEASVNLSDARALQDFSHLNGRVRLVLTSPPYPNNYDYADATRLEMTFWGQVGSWKDLHGAVRRHLVRSCSQHSAADKLSLDVLLADAAVAPIRGELTEVCEQMAVLREQKAGKKTYHTMVAAYFVDLAKVWSALKPLMASNGEICFIIGDSAPYGVHVPAERWLGELALAAGFSSCSFEKIRDRNLKWKNRKHRVPLQEGALWVQNG